MATKPATKDTSPPVEENKVVALRTADSLPAHLRDDIDEYAGAGTSTRREDTLVPFLYIAQKGSPQVNKKDPAYIEGLEPGMLFDTSTRKTWAAEGEGEGPVVVQAHVETREVEWGLRGSAEKGYKGAHPVDTSLLKSIREIPKEQGRGILRMLPNNHQLVTTAYHYVILVDDLRPIAVPMSASNFSGPHRALNTLFRNKKVRNRSGQLVVRPSFSTLLRLKTQWVSNDMGDWYVYGFEDLGDLTEGYLDAYEEAKLLYRSAVAGELKTAEPPAEESSTIDGAADPDADPADASPL